MREPLRTFDTGACLRGKEGLHVCNMRRKVSFHGVKTELESDHKALWHFQRGAAL